MNLSKIKIEKKIKNEKEIIYYKLWVNDKFFTYQLISPLNCTEGYPTKKEIKKIAIESYLKYET